jgi:hypothetical protein
MYIALEYWLRKWSLSAQRSLLVILVPVVWVSHSWANKLLIWALFSDITHNNCCAFLASHSSSLLVESYLWCSLCIGIPMWNTVHTHVHCTYIQWRCIICHYRCVAVLFHPKKRKRVHVRNKYVLREPSLCKTFDMLQLYMYRISRPYSLVLRAELQNVKTVVHGRGCMYM